MSNFEIGQLKHYLKSANKRNDIEKKRNDYMVTHLSLLAYKAINKNVWTNDERGEYLNLVSNWVQYMKYVDSDLIPSLLFDKELYIRFYALHSQWLEEENDMGFIEWLRIEENVEE